MSLATDFEYDTDADATEDYFERGFTDGLPIVPPTPDRVEAMLAAGGLDAEDALGEVKTRNVVVTAEKVAVNAVMAGARPDYFPTIVASVRALLQPMANAHSTTVTLAGSSQCLIVNGPVRNQIGVFGGQGCFGPGWRANATIGRSLRLVARNVLNSVPGVLDRAVFASPMRYSFCFAENEDVSDWVPLHVQRGFSPGDSVVTLVSVMELLQSVEMEPEPEAIIATLAAITRQRGVIRDEWCGDDRSLVMAIGAEHQRRFLDAGWSKRDIQEALWPLLTAPATGKHDRSSYLVSPDKILLVAAGGPGLPMSCVITPHLSNPSSQLIV